MPQWLLMQVPEHINLEDDMRGGFITAVSDRGFRVHTQTTNIHVCNGTVEFGSTDISGTAVAVQANLKCVRKCDEMTLAEGIAIHTEAARQLSNQSLAIRIANKLHEKPVILR